MRGDERGDLGGVEGRAATHTEHAISTRGDAGLGDLAHRVLRGLAGWHCVGDDIEAVGADRRLDRGDHAALQQEGVGHEEHARRAQQLQMVAGLERGTRAERDRRDVQNANSLGAHFVPRRSSSRESHSSRPRMPLSSSNGIIRGTDATVEPSAFSWAANSFVDCAAANSVEVG